VIDILKSKITLYINSSSEERKSGQTSSVYLYENNAEKYAYKEYAQNGEEYDSMEMYIDDILRHFTEDEKKNMRAWAAIPLAKVKTDSSGRFIGFIMDRIPDGCYRSNGEERNLDNLFKDVDRYSDNVLKKFTKRLQMLIRFLHRHNVLLGDVLSGRNICVREESGDLFPYLIDIDSLLLPGVKHPLGTYDSPNYITPAFIKKGDKSSDIYKFCLIVLRIFSSPKKYYDRVDLKFDEEDDIVNKSFERIGRVFGEEYRDNIKKGLSEHFVSGLTIDFSANFSSAKDNSRTAVVTTPKITANYSNTHSHTDSAGENNQRKDADILKDCVRVIRSRLILNILASIALMLLIVKSDSWIIWKSPIYLPAIVAVVAVAEGFLLVLPKLVSDEDVNKVDEMTGRSDKIFDTNRWLVEYIVLILLIVCRKVFLNRILDHHITLIIDTVVAGIFNLELVLFLIWHTPKRIKKIGSIPLKNGDQIVLWVLSILDYLVIAGLALLMIAGGASLIKGI
jgi:membrane protein